MLFRSDFWAQEKLKDSPINRDHRNISRIAGYCWDKLPEEERDRYRQRSIERKKAHALQHPGYKYTPSIRRDRSAVKRKLKKGVDEGERCKELASFVLESILHTALGGTMKSATETPMKGASPSPFTSESHCTSRSHSSDAMSDITAPLPPKTEKQEYPTSPDGVHIEKCVALEMPRRLSNFKEEEKEMFFDSQLRPPSYDASDSPFDYPQSGINDLDQWNTMSNDLLDFQGGDLDVLTGLGWAGSERAVVPAAPEQAYHTSSHQRIATHPASPSTTIFSEVELSKYFNL